MGCFIGSNVSWSFDEETPRTVKKKWDKLNFYNQSYSYFDEFLIYTFHIFLIFSFSFYLKKKTTTELSWFVHVSLSVLEWNIQFYKMLYRNMKV